MPCSSSAYKKFLALIWVGWIIHAFFFAPQQEVAGMEEIMQLAQLDTSAFDALVIALFNLMGVWPMIMAAILLTDGRGQRLPAWPFLLGSCVLGNFVLFPYILMRRPNPRFEGEKTIGVRFGESKLFALVIAVMAVSMIGFGVLQGSFNAFIASFKVNNLVNIMSIDFLLFLFAFPAILGDDMLRRGLTSTRQFWWYTLVPVLGAVAYLLARPPLLAAEAAYSD